MEEMTEPMINDPAGMSSDESVPIEKLNVKLKFGDKFTKRPL